jgi:hypothetical protein
LDTRRFDNLELSKHAVYTIGIDYMILLKGKLKM